MFPTMSAASFETSVPAIPIATLIIFIKKWSGAYKLTAYPISAFLRAGESLTPSPVTATTCPALLDNWQFG